MKLLAFALFTIGLSSSAHAGGASTVSTKCYSKDKTQFIGFEQNIAWFKKGQSLESYYNLKSASGKSAAGRDQVTIEENSETNFNVSGPKLTAEIKFLTGDFGPVEVTATLGSETVEFQGTCSAD